MPSLAGRLQVVIPAVALLFVFASSASAANFTCAAAAAALGTTCNAAIAYAVPNATTYSELVVRFNTTSTIADLLGANGLPPTYDYEDSSTPITAETVVRVPFRCRCGRNGVGESVGGPIYVVQPMDGLDHIARDVFDAFVTYQEIATANNISDVNLIQIGQKLRIPLPCSCDQVDGADVMHLAYSVAEGEDSPGIAAKFGVAENTLLSVNKITDPKSLQQGQILDVPLPVCNSSIDHLSADHNLLLPYGTYAVTAQGCVQCSCMIDQWNKDQQLDCVPVQDEKCPAVPVCTGALKLGQACGSKMCAYEGYVSDSTSLTIYTTLVAADNKTSRCQNVSAGPLIDLSGGSRRQNKLILKVGT
ncbi:chitin elicitor-binding protein isoform X2 [Sorghum bicolor]|uniref:chitin elicitor-binding protein isoform X2 n=1 Tax=Sorghum bicolor TaxID=4558 RepID=UPI000B424A90|nr:chitin elicitor-binding protein isoform X2 [Sorghum bicolor]|eukprot:XP_021302963.1 chitin elicitor-binding protein isoform X2 [Sorghum bicolor]